MPCGYMVFAFSIYSLFASSTYRFSFILSLFLRRRRNIKKNVYFQIRFIYSIQFKFRPGLNWSLLGVKKRLGHAQIGLLLGSDEHPRSFHMGVPPGSNPNSKSGAYHRPLSKSNSIS